MSYSKIRHIKNINLLSELRFLNSKLIITEGCNKSITINPKNGNPIYIDSETGKECDPKDTKYYPIPFNKETELEANAKACGWTLDYSLMGLTVADVDGYTKSGFECPKNSGKKSKKYLKLLDNYEKYFNQEQNENIQLIGSYIEKKGITDPYAQIGILSVIGKECNYIPQNEIDYSNTENSEIRTKFNNAKKIKDDDELNKIKKNPEKFFNLVYGGRNENTLPGDGFKYRGRGFNQLTFKGNYKKYGGLVGLDLVNNPNLLNDSKVAANVAVEFLLKGKTNFPKFNTKEDAVNYFADLNAGGDTGHRERAIKYSTYFNLKNEKK